MASVKAEAADLRERVVTAEREAAEAKSVAEERSSYTKELEDQVSDLCVICHDICSLSP